MSTELLVALSAVFVTVASLSGLLAWTIFERTAPAQRRLREFAASSQGSLVKSDTALTYAPSAAERLQRFIPRSPSQLTATRRLLIRAGFYSPTAVAVYGLLELATPIVVAGLLFTLLPPAQRLIFTVLGGLLGFLLPGVVLGRLIAARQKRIRKGLPDALDLMVVCVEAGSALDQAVVKTAEDLGLTHPDLAHELKLVNIEMRAGKPRLEALKNLAERTGVDEVRALVAMMVQTDRFGTSIAQALRTHADSLRTQRRQEAEERAAKLGVKLVFPLVFCLFPALFVVILGPGAIKIFRQLIQNVGNR
jgi:tight adherence protein C